MLKIQAIGHLGKDAVIKEVGGKKVINFSVAHTEKWKDGQNVDREKTTWIECSMWEKENVAPFLKTGTQVYVEGTPGVNVWNGTDTGEALGNLKMTVFSLQLLSSKKEA